MDPLVRLERWIEQMVEEPFVRLFAGQLLPQEVARRLANALEDGERVGADGLPEVPGRYRIYLNPDDLSALLARTRTELADALRHVSVVRYDAFGDMGGRLSFSAALLDDGGDGLVLTAIHGRTETRSYIKGVKAGQSDASLSPEEQQAITFAMRGASA